MRLFAAFSRLVMARIGLLFASGDSRDAETLALRHQILVLQRLINRPQFTDTDRTILSVLGSAMTQARRNTASPGRSGADSVLVPGHPEVLIRHPQGDPLPLNRVDHDVQDDVEHTPTNRNHHGPSRVTEDPIHRGAPVPNSSVVRYVPRENMPNSFIYRI
jgi:hypothetical protein